MEVVVIVEVVSFFKLLQGVDDSISHLKSSVTPGIPAQRGFGTDRLVVVIEVVVVSNK